MVFGVQKGGFCIARSGFLHCKSMVFVFWMLCCCNLFRMLSQSVRSEMAIRQQHYRNPLAAVGSPIYRARIYENTHKMTNGNVRALKWIYIFNNIKTHIRWFEYTCLIMWKHIFGYGNTRFCLCQDTGTMNLPLRLADCSPRIHGTNMVYWGGMQG